MYRLRRRSGLPIGSQMEWAVGLQKVAPMILANPWCRLSGLRPLQEWSFKCLSRVRTNGIRLPITTQRSMEVQEVTGPILHKVIPSRSMESQREVVIGPTL